MKVPVGPATIAGYGSAFISALIAGLEALAASGQAPSSVKWLAILSAGLVALTNFNRSIQAPKPPEETPPQI